MGNITDKVDAASAHVMNSNNDDNKEQPKKLKPCCACPETKKVRDAW